MAGYDQGAVYFSEQGAQFGEEEAPGVVKAHAARKFADFLRNFRDDPTTGRPDGETVYRDQLDADPPPKTLTVCLDDLIKHDAELAALLRKFPGDYIPLLEAAASEVLASLRTDAAGDGEAEGRGSGGVQVLLRSFETPRSIRNLTSDDVSHLVVIPGIVIGASRCKSKATTIVVQCKVCKNSKTIICNDGMGGAFIPRSCDLQPAGSESCGLEPFVIQPDKGTYIDQQSLKLQEMPEAVPAGEMPRNMLLLVERHVAQTIVPGQRVLVAGVFSIQAMAVGGGKSRSDKKAATAIQQPYIRVVGIDLLGEGDRRSATAFSDEEVRNFREFASRPTAEVWGLIRNMVAPAIYGHDGIKAAIACLLFGGSRKRLADGVRLRGDVNVLLIGDPSTAKSQFLKFVEKTAPIAVYTSGKGSSAAGLTASVIRDPGSGEFYLEGGAMVLADGGVVCIDEFDKMRPDDRVAIHEAMEQQTISIAKAGITTVLNSRTAVFAAANPPSGRYDDLKTAQENIDLQTTILSRFDLIFIVRDERDYAKDKAIAQHVVHIHRDAQAGGGDAGDVSLSLLPSIGESRTRSEAFLKRYVEYARAACRPRLSEGGARSLENNYVRIRSEMRDRSRDRGEAPAVPITVRQLEAVVRLSESLAKMCLQPVASEAHVQEALRLFTVSTIDAAKSGLQEMTRFTEEQQSELRATEERVRQRLPIGAVASKRALIDELVRYGLSEWAVERAILGMQQRHEVELRNEGRRIMRKAS